MYLVAQPSRARERLEEALESADLEVAGVAGNLEAIREADLAAVDVMLARTNDETPSEVLEGIEECGALEMTRVALLMDEVAPSWVNQALRVGVRGILPAELDGNQLSAAIRAIALGLVVLYPSEGPWVRESTADAYGVESLTPRETEVMQMLGQGRSNKEIAELLKISEHTAKFHVASVLGKLRAATRAEAVSIAMRRGLISLQIASARVPAVFLPAAGSDKFRGYGKSRRDHQGNPGDGREAVQGCSGKPEARGRLLQEAGDR